MKKLAAYIVPLALAAASCAKQPQATQTSTPPATSAPASTFSTPRTFDANLAFGPGKTVELQRPESNKVTFKLMFKNGSMSDPAGKEGLTFTTAQLLTESGSQTMTLAQIKDKLYPMAAQYSVNVDKEVTTFTFSVHQDFLEEFYQMMRGILLTPAFAEEDFKRVISNQQNYVDQVIRASSDEEYSKKALEDLLFRGTNYQHKPEGTSAGVKSITLEDVTNHYRTFFTRHNVMIGVAGNYSPEFLSQLKQDVAQLPETEPTIPAAGRPNQPNGVQVEIIKKSDALGSAIFTGTPMPITRTADEFAALMVANSYLGEHRKSYGKLYDKIRSTRSMNYGDYSYIEWYDNGGSSMLPNPGVPRTSNYFALWIRPVQIAEGLRKQYPELKDITVGHAHFALRLAIREVDNLVRNGMTQEEFELTRKFLRSYMKLYIQTEEKQLGFLMDSQFYGRQDYLQEMDALLEKLTVEDVNNTVKKYWQVNNMFVTIVTDDSEAEPLAEALRENTPSPMSYSNLVKEGLPAEVVAEDNTIATYDLNIKSVKVIDSQDTFK
ncbi:insulinase family protein [Pontibacter qinzhouensis]|uniref:Insulinase family protein n=1 Tax=Pontibacter qinzhouensis TaxID=2603253 RepID=A0A5C8JIQ2_9BACT|nr:pitrilysin family protein [Pontibacter qinzhouensis]TXK37659.1 insulinase family protein [Pontibacter qinzhouensis]